MEEEKKTSPDLPQFYHMESFRREEFLSQLGSFTQVQFQLFHNLCDFWLPVLEYNQFILKSSKSFLASNNQLELLMDKLKAAHIGLLQYTLIDGELKAHRIILSEKNDFSFYYYLCEDLLARQILNNKQPFMTEKAFDDEGIALPKDMMTILESRMLSPGFAEASKEKPLIIAVPRKMKAPLLLPSGMLEEFIPALVPHVRSEMTNTRLMEYLSRITDRKISELQKGLTKREPPFWISICQAFPEHKEEIKLRFKGLNPLLFTSVQLLQTYFQNSLNEIKEAQIVEQEKIKATDELISEFRAKEASWTPVTLLDERLKEKEETWKGFREEFRTAALVRGENKSLPPLIVINNMLIHRDFLFRYFTRETGLLRKDLFFFYQEQMRDLLRRNRTERYSQFFSRNNFRADILDRIKDKDLQLWELLQKPTKVAEAAFHYLQTIKGIKKTSRIKDALGLYFLGDMKTFRNIDSMMQLKLLTLFEQAYKELGWWSRFILRITGRYDSYIGMFSDDSPQKDSYRNPSRRKKRRRGPRIPRAAKSRLREDQRNYSAREKKRAWEEFGQAVQKESHQQPEEPAPD
jgi:hypothetical protein